MTRAKRFSGAKGMIISGCGNLNIVVVDFGFELMDSRSAEGLEGNWLVAERATFEISYYVEQS